MVIFNLFRLLENKTFELFSKREGCKSKLKFVGVKVYKAEEVRKYFENPKIENEIFDLLIVWISEIQKQSFAEVIQNRYS